MSKLLKFGEYTVDSSELETGEYKCDPALCKGNVCCAIFDIAVTFEERIRISEYIYELYKYCPWLKDFKNVFKITPCEILIKKRENNLCLFNWEDEEGRAWCALHSLALEKGENPFKLKPLNCSLWPFLRDGNNNLELDRHTNAPCLKLNNTKVEKDPELLAMLKDISK